MMVKENMTKYVVTIDPSTTIKVAWEIMGESEFRHLPVVVERRLVGIISDRDLLVYNPDGEGASEETVETCMTPAPITVAKNTVISTAANLMVQHKIDCLPVVEGGILKGMITSTDLLELLATGLVSERATLPWDYEIRYALNRFC